MGGGRQMNLRRSLAVTLLLLLLVGRPAGATQCVPGITLAEHIQGADTVVLGRVVAVDLSVIQVTPLPNGNSIQAMPEGGVPYTLAVERVFRSPGDSARGKLTVHSRGIDGAPNLDVGDRWLLFLHRDEAGRLQTSPCNPSRQLRPGEQLPPDLAAALGPGRAAAAVPGWVWLAAAGLALVSVPGWQWYRRRRMA